MVGSEGALSVHCSDAFTPFMTGHDESGKGQLAGGSDEGGNGSSSNGGNPAPADALAILNR
jgi:hypothetical protein